MGNVTRRERPAIAGRVGAPLPRALLLVDIQVVDEWIRLPQEQLALARSLVPQSDSSPPYRTGEADIGCGQRPGRECRARHIFDGQRALGSLQQADVPGEFLAVDTLGGGQGGRMPAPRSRLRP